MDAVTASLLVIDFAVVAFIVCWVVDAVRDDQHQPAEMTDLAERALIAPRIRQRR